MRIGLIGPAALREKDQTVFGQLGQQTEILTQPEQLAAVDGLWLSAVRAEDLRFLYNWRQVIRSRTDLAVMGAALGACALGQNGPLGLMDYRACCREEHHLTAELLRIPSWEDHRLTAVFGPEVRFQQIAPNLGIVCQTVERGPVVLRQGNFLAASFLPEETADRATYHYFLEMVRRSGESDLPRG